MDIITTIKEMQNYSNAARRKEKSIGLVPTMGFLHEGHLSLIDKARKNADIVIVSIFVNPTQFGPNEDLSTYPRDMESDCKLCETRKVDVIFAPQNSEVYPSDSSTWVNEEKLSKGLCGQKRPTHFRGVTTIVAKLFNATLPDCAIFGEKDFQQVAIIKRMVRDLNFPIKVITSPIIREKDGLAMSSRNKYLSCEDRKRALAINTSLSRAKVAILAKEDNNNPKLESIINEINLRISQSSGVVDYIEVVDPITLEPKIDLSGEILIAVAAHYGKTRLIDNILITSINTKNL